MSVYIYIYSSNFVYTYIYIYVIACMHTGYFLIPNIGRCPLCLELGVIAVIGRIKNKHKSDLLRVIVCSREKRWILPFVLLE